MTPAQEEHFFEVVCKVFGVDDDLTQAERAELLEALPAEYR